MVVAEFFNKNPNKAELYAGVSDNLRQLVAQARANIGPAGDDCLSQLAGTIENCANLLSGFVNRSAATQTSPRFTV